MGSNAKHAKASGRALCRAALQQGTKQDIHAQSQAQCHTLMKPISFAYSLKHCRHMFRLYFRMMPHLLLHTRLQRGNTGVRGLSNNLLL